MRDMARHPLRTRKRSPRDMIRVGIVCAVLLLIPLAASTLAEPVSAMPSPANSGWFVDLSRFSQSAHRNFTCEACHGDMRIQGQPHPNTRDTARLKRDARRVYDYNRCSACHRESHERYLRGAHAKALTEERKRPASQGSDPERLKAPTCGECHSAHYSPSHLRRGAVGREMTEVCGACHPAQKATYLANYHGKAAVHLANEASAYCTDCHGAHECVSLKERKAAIAACQRCHPDAGERFAQFVIHPTDEGLAKENKEKQRHVTLIRVVTVIMTIIVALVVAFFYGHSFLWFLRELHERLRKHKGSD